MSIAEYTRTAGRRDYFDYLWEIDDIDELTEIVVGLPSDYEDPREYDARVDTLIGGENGPGTAEWAEMKRMLWEYVEDSYIDSIDWAQMQEDNLASLRTELTRNDYVIHAGAYDDPIDGYMFHDADAIIDRFDLDLPNVSWRLSMNGLKDYVLEVWNENLNDTTDHPDTYILEYGLYIDADDERHYERKKPRRPLIMNVNDTVTTVKLLAHEKHNA